jgi:protein gp37
VPTKIEWATDTWNPITGCTKISEACQNCYAERMSKRLAGRCGYPEGEPFRVTLHPDKLDQPMRWKKPRMIFVCSMGDLFHEDVPNSFLDQIFAVMAKAEQHIFLLLTKRPKRAKEYILRAMYDENCNYQGWYEAINDLEIPDVTPMENVWLGVTAENQQRADERIPILMQIPAAKRFVSIEPMLGMVDLSIPPHIDWVICGGETGPGARPMHLDWVRSLRDQCQAAGVPFFFKSWGEWMPSYETGATFELSRLKTDEVVMSGPGHGVVMKKVGKKAAGRLLDGQTWEQRP